jgi:tRNA pseudouridine55 synthase
VNGILNINKPPGITSFGVVARARRICGQRRVGHGGTLDPEASGVLPVFISKATHAADYLLEYRKIYQAGIRLGITTDTFDAAGKITQEADTSRITPEDVRRALASFSGEIMQTPPMYSALKHNGRPLYKLAREGVSIERSGRQVTVYRIELLGLELPSVKIEVECSRGTYIRSLAHDLGRLLGCGAHLQSLTRTRYGPFDIKDALPPEILESLFAENAWRDVLQPVDVIMKHLPSISLNEEEEKIIRNGGEIARDDISCPDEAGRRCRAYRESGEFFAVVRFYPEAGLLKAENIFG